MPTFSVEAGHGVKCRRQPPPYSLRDTTTNDEGKENVPLPVRPPTRTPSSQDRERGVHRSGSTSYGNPLDPPGSIYASSMPTDRATRKSRPKIRPVCCWASGANNLNNRSWDYGGADKVERGATNEACVSPERERPPAPPRLGRRSIRWEADLLPSARSREEMGGGASSGAENGSIATVRASGGVPSRGRPATGPEWAVAEAGNGSESLIGSDLASRGGGASALLAAGGMDRCVSPIGLVGRLTRPRYVGIDIVDGIEEEMMPQLPEEGEEMESDVSELASCGGVSAYLDRYADAHRGERTMTVHSVSPDNTLYGRRTKPRGSIKSDGMSREDGAVRPEGMASPVPELASYGSVSARTGGCTGYGGSEAKTMEVERSLYVDAEDETCQIGYPRHNKQWVNQHHGGRYSGMGNTDNDSRPGAAPVNRMSAANGGEEVSPIIPERTVRHEDGAPSGGSGEEPTPDDDTKKPGCNGCKPWFLMDDPDQEMADDYEEWVNEHRRGTYGSGMGYSQNRSRPGTDQMSPVIGDDRLKPIPEHAVRQDGKVPNKGSKDSPNMWGSQRCKPWFLMDDPDQEMAEDDTAVHDIVSSLLCSGALCVLCLAMHL